TCVIFVTCDGDTILQCSVCILPNKDHTYSEVAELEGIDKRQH
ncbi:16118_t:CDS:1, partial [Cetraspora pellucida]